MCASTVEGVCPVQKKMQKSGSAPCAPPRSPLSFFVFFVVFARRVRIRHREAFVASLELKNFSLIKQRCEMKAMQPHPAADVYEKTVSRISAPFPKPIVFIESCSLPRAPLLRTHAFLSPIPLTVSRSSLRATMSRQRTLNQWSDFCCCTLSSAPQSPRHQHTHILYRSADTQRHTHTWKGKNK